MWIVISLCALVVVSGGAGVFLLTRFPRAPRGPGSNGEQLTATRR